MVMVQVKSDVNQHLSEEPSTLHVKLHTVQNPNGTLPSPSVSQMDHDNTHYLV